MKIERWTTAAISRENSVQFTNFRCKGKFLSSLRAVIFISGFVGEVCSLYRYCGWFSHTLVNKGCRAQQLMEIQDLCTWGSVENADSRERGRQQVTLADRTEGNKFRWHLVTLKRNKSRKESEFSSPYGVLEFCCSVVDPQMSQIIH